MGWIDNEPEGKKSGMTMSSKLLLAIIACILLIIVLIVVLLVTMETNTSESYTISVDGVANTKITKENLLTKIDGVTYINIEEFAKLVKYEYHQGEYKGHTTEKDKCYVQGEDETASFYLNENKVLKLAVGKINEDYQEYIVENPIKESNEKIYASIDAIAIAFNSQITEKDESLNIFSLDYLTKWYDKKLKELGYTTILSLTFENQKAILYDRFIVKKENGLYKIIDKEQKEILSDKYAEIEFIEISKEFLVTNSLGQKGIIDWNGEIVVEPIYKEISVLNKDFNLYLIKKDEKYGVVKGGNITIINPEFDNIGVTVNSEKKYMVLDNLIPVYKNGKWGAFDKGGKLICNIEYDNFGSTETTVDVGNYKKTVNTVFEIEECKGLVVKKDNKYGVLNKNGEVIIPIQVDRIYSIVNSNDETEYYMLYNNEELNILDMLIEQGLIEEPNKKEEISNTIENQNTTSQQVSNIIENNVTE